MQSNLILTTTQAQAALATMATLKSAGGNLAAEFGDGVSIKQDNSAQITIYHAVRREDYPDPSALAAAYGLNPRERTYLLTGLWDDGARWAVSYPATSPEDAEEQAQEEYPGVQIAAVIELAAGEMRVVA